MKFELSDETLLMVAGAGNALFAAHAMAAPKHFHNTYMSEVGVGRGRSATAAAAYRRPAARPVPP